LKRGNWQGKEICGIIRILAVNWDPTLDCSKDEGKTVVENASSEMVMGAVWALCDICLLVPQQNQWDLSLKALDDTLN
jgi:hypothetical protein